jgi:hypothetical protein
MGAIHVSPWRSRRVRALRFRVYGKRKCVSPISVTPLTVASDHENLVTTFQVLLEVEG